MSTADGTLRVEERNAPLHHQEFWPWGDIMGKSGSDAHSGLSGASCLYIIHFEIEKEMTR